MIELFKPKKSDLMADIYKHMKLREGEVLRVYKDSLGFPTVGIGHLVLKEDKLRLGDTITPAQSKAFFDKDVAKALAAARVQAKEIGAEDDYMLIALTSVNFQLGTGWTREFKNTYRMICEGKYDDAINALRKSLWARQTPVRVKDFVTALMIARDTKK